MTRATAVTSIELSDDLDTPPPDYNASAEAPPDSRESDSPPPSSGAMRVAYVILVTLGICWALALVVLPFVIPPAAIKVWKATSVDPESYSTTMWILIMYLFGGFVFFAIIGGVASVAAGWRVPWPLLIFGGLALVTELAMGCFAAKDQNPIRIRESREKYIERLAPDCGKEHEMACGLADREVTYAGGQCSASEVDGVWTCANATYLSCVHTQCSSGCEQNSTECVACRTADCETLNSWFIPLKALTVIAIVFVTVPAVIILSFLAGFGRY